MTYATLNKIDRSGIGLPKRPKDLEVIKGNAIGKDNDEFQQEINDMIAQRAQLQQQQQLNRTNLNNLYVTGVNKITSQGFRLVETDNQGNIAKVFDEKQTAKKVRDSVTRKQKYQNMTDEQKQAKTEKSKFYKNKKRNADEISETQDQPVQEAASSFAARYSPNGNEARLKKRARTNEGIASIITQGPAITSDEYFQELVEQGRKNQLAL